MKTYILLTFLTISLTMNAQETKRPDPIDVTDRLSYQDFQEIKQFVLDGGQTRTYCNMYSNNPYYELNDEVELYLNPIIQFVSAKDSKKPEVYNTIVIYMLFQNPNYPFSRTYIRENSETKKIYVESYYTSEDDMELRNKGFEEFIGTIQDAIEKEKSLNSAPNSVTP